MSMIPTFKDLQGSNATTSGIITKFDSSDRVVPETRRPDGTLRKERKIRPGFMPAEDAAKFKSSRMREAEAKALPKGTVIGMQRPTPSSAAVALANAHLSAAAKKNAKRKEKRKQGTASSPDPPDDWEAEVDQAAPVVPAAETSLDGEKRSRALQKKIKQAEQLKEKATKGETLLPEQTAKVSSLPALVAELEGLSLAPPPSDSPAVKNVLEQTADLEPANTAAAPEAT